MRTLEAFYAYDKAIHLIVVLPVDQQDYWKHLCQEYAFTLPHQIADGGETRFHSVKNGLALVEEEDALVGVCYRMAERKGAAIPVIDVVETVRWISEDGESETVPRDRYKLVQTPQVFRASLLKQAYAQPYTSAFTDDASVVEAFGHRVELVKGNRENIKL